MKGSILLSESLSQRVSSQGEGSYSGLSQGASRRYTPGSLISNKPNALPLGVSSQSMSAQSSSSGSPSTQSRFGTLFGSSTGIASQGMGSSYSGSVQSQGTTSQFAPGSQSPYDSLYCKCALSPQGVDREPTTVQSSRKQFTSSYGTQSGSSTPFTLLGSITYDRSPRPQGTASQLGPMSHTYP